MKKFNLAAFAVIALAIIFVANSCKKELIVDAIVVDVTITTAEVTEIGDITATSGGEITVTNDYIINERGVCYSTTSNPTVEDIKHTNGAAGVGSYESVLSDLEKGVTYYLKAYCVNQVFEVFYGEEVSFTTTYETYLVGEVTQGGTVVYVDSTGKHGVISAGERTAESEWGCSGTLINNTSIDIGTGQSNTDLILAACSGPTVARFCDEFVLNGYDDWYWPSWDEVELIYLYSIANGVVWAGMMSSSEYDATTAYAQDDNGNRGGLLKTVTGSTVPVRSF